MRILVLSFYYKPDLSAGSFRTAALADTLQNHLQDGYTAEILTTQPNRYHSYPRRASRIEENQNIRVVRFSLSRHKSGFIDQSLSFVSYATQVLWYTRGKQYDLVYATSSRLMTAFLGALISRKKGIPLYLDIRDIFIDTLRDVGASLWMKLLFPLLGLIEKFTVRQAARINLVSEGFRQYFQMRYPSQSYRFIPNGIDESFLDFDFEKKSVNSNGRCVVLYAGNIGDSQGLHRILPDLARETFETHQFIVVGDGGMRDELGKAVENLENVQILPPVDRAALMQWYRDSDILFLHLNDYPAFRKVLPSKIFEYAATGKPILAGVAGYAADFVQGIIGAVSFPPCDARAGVAGLRSLSAGGGDRGEFRERYRRTVLMQSLVADVMAVARMRRAKDRT